MSDWNCVQVQAQAQKQAFVQLNIWKPHASSHLDFTGVSNPDVCPWNIVEVFPPKQ